MLGFLGDGLDQCTQVQMQFAQVEIEFDDGAVTGQWWVLGSLIWSVWKVFEVENWDMHEWNKNLDVKAQHCMFMEFGDNYEFVLVLGWL